MTHNVVAPPAVAVAPARRIPWGPIVMGLGLVAVGAIGIVALVKSDQKRDDEGAYVVVDQRARTDAGAHATDPVDAGAAAGPDVDADVAVAPIADAGVRRTDHGGGGGSASGSAGPQDTVKNLTRTFGKQMGKVHDCFEAHSGDSDGTTELSVRFHVETDGHVADAELVPSSLGSTPLGGCLLGIARATRFDTLEQPITFRVPLRARVKPQ
jgi:hypothetical protein